MYTFVQSMAVNPWYMPKLLENVCMLRQVCERMCVCVCVRTYVSCVITKNTCSLHARTGADCVDRQEKLVHAFAHSMVETFPPYSMLWGWFTDIQEFRRRFHTAQG